MKNRLLSNYIVVYDDGRLLTLREIEEFMLRKALEVYPNRTHAAKALGMSRSSCYRKMREYKIV